MDKSLSKSDHKESILLGVIVAGKHSQISSKSGVVRARSNKTKSKDSILSNLLVGIVSKFCEHIDGCNIRVRNSEETNSQRYNFLDDRLSVSQELVQSSNTHFLTDIFSESDEGNSKNSSNLMKSILFLSFVLRKEMEELLDLENVSSSGLSKSIDQKLSIGREVLILKYSASFK